MSNVTGILDDGRSSRMRAAKPSRPTSRRLGGLALPVLTGGLALGFSAAVGLHIVNSLPASPLELSFSAPAVAPQRVVVAEAPAVAPRHAKPTVLDGLAPLLDPAAVGRPATLADSAPLPSQLVARAVPGDAAPAATPTAATLAPEPDADAVASAPTIALPPSSAPAVVAALEASVPLPTPRPPDLWTTDRPAPYRPAPRSRVAMGRAPVPTVAAPTDNRSFFEKLFGAPTEPAPSGVLAYAAPETDLFRNAGRVTGGVIRSAEGGTAVYNIAAHTVTLPNGTQLEAHSGLGSRLDDPRFVHERNRGPTPPHVYDLTARESLFHGVQAIRLNPVGGGGVFGRVGLLAHTYMLGPNGDSNGCVSFRNYGAFLQAFRNGEVRRLMVVTGQS